MQFLSSELLWLLLAIPALIGVYCWILCRKRRVLRYASLGAVREALTCAQAVRRHLPPALFLVAIVVLVLSVARPAAVATQFSAQKTILLVMDVSLSMAATDVTPSRLAAAQAAAKDFIRAQPRDVRIGIIAFAGSADLVQAPTTERTALYTAIDRLRLDYHTAIGTGLIAALVTLFPTAGVDQGYDIFGAGHTPAGFQPFTARTPPRERSPRLAPGSNTEAAIILLTDGSATMGLDPVKVAQIAADHGVRVFTVGFGTANGGTVSTDGWAFDVGFDEATLKAIAKVTRGEYFHAASAPALKNVYRTLSSRIIVERRKYELTALFTAAAAVLALVAAALSTLWFHQPA